jgi:hypothetical protein
LRDLVAQTAPGSTVKFKVWRDGADHGLTTTLAEMDSKDLAAGAKGGGLARRAARSQGSA